jgi:uncharacterized protein
MAIYYCHLTRFTGRASREKIGHLPYLEGGIGRTGPLVVGIRPIPYNGGMGQHAAIIELVLRHYPNAQGIYLFGSYGTQRQWPQSDVDIAVLLPHTEAKTAKHMMLSPCRSDLETLLHREVDLLNLRQVSTVFQKEIIFGTLIHCADRYAVDEFEMLVLSFYQKLNEERAEVMAEGLSSGRFYNV